MAICRTLAELWRLTVFQKATKLELSVRLRVPICVIVQNFVGSGQTVPEMCRRFSDIFKMASVRHPCVCY